MYKEEARVHFSHLSLLNKKKKKRNFHFQMKSLSQLKRKETSEKLLCSTIKLLIVNFWFDLHSRKKTRKGARTKLQFEGNKKGS